MKISLFCVFQRLCLYACAQSILEKTNIGRHSPFSYNSRVELLERITRYEQRSRWISSHQFLFEMKIIFSWSLSFANCDVNKDLVLPVYEMKNVSLCHMSNALCHMPDRYYQVSKVTRDPSTIINHAQETNLFSFFNLLAL